MSDCFRSYSLLCGLLCTLLLAGTQEVHAQEASKDALREAFANGNAKAVLAQAAERVELSLPEGSSQYSRSQAVYVLQQFFDDRPPRRFAWERTSSGDRSAGSRSRFLTGHYWPEGAQPPLLVHLRMAKGQGGSGWQLQEVRVERP